MNTRHRTLLSALAAVTTLTLNVAPAAAIYETTCPVPCKSNLFVRQTSGLTDGSGIFSLTGTLAKGLKRNVLRIDTTVSFTTASAGTSDVAMYVNGVIIKGGVLFGIDHGTSCPGGICAFSGSYWMDLDAAEVTNPGLFIGQPLVIQMEGNAPGGGVQAFGASISAQLVKKK